MANVSCIHKVIRGITDKVERKINFKNMLIVYMHVSQVQ